VTRGVTMVGDGQGRTFEWRASKQARLSSASIESQKESRNLRTHASARGVLRGSGQVPTTFLNDHRMGHGYKINTALIDRASARPLKRNPRHERTDVT